MKGRSIRLTENEARQWSLWRIMVQNCYRRRVKVSEILDLAAGYQLDQYWAIDMLMYWLHRGDLRRSEKTNYVVLQRGRWIP